MKKLFTLSAGLLIGSSTVLAQPAIDWQKNFQGSSATLKTEFDAVSATSDGGCIAVGKGKGSGGDLPGGYIDHGDALIIKTAADGTVQWSDYWGKQEEDGALAVIQTADDGYVVAGYTYHFGSNDLGGADGFVVKYNASGLVQWEHNYGGSGHDFIYDIRQNSDGSYIFVGSTKSPEISGYHGGSDLWIAKIDATGNELWSKCKGYTGEDAASALALNSDGSFIVTGKTNSSGATNYKGNYDIWTLKITAAGAIAWQTCIGGTKSDGGSSVIVANDGNITIAGTTKSNDGDISGNHSNDKYDLVVAHLDASGTLINTKVYGGADNEATGFTDNQSIRQTSDGGFVLLTSSNSNNGDVSGNKGSYDFWLLKTNASDNIEWQECIGSATQDYAHSLDISKDGGYILAGQYNNQDAFLVKMKGNNVGIKDLSTFHTSVYPNPVYDVLHITTDKAIQSGKIVDVMGRIVWSSSNIDNKKIDVSALTSGIYFLQINFKDGQLGVAKIQKQ